jgi:MFS family permease
MTVAVFQSQSEADRAQMRAAVIVSTVVTTFVWYDFFLYGTMAGFVFGKLYFPNSDALSATLLAFGIYFIGFVARPIGAAIFGHYGDRIGRKAALNATLWCMGLATFAIAFVPTYASIGIWGAILLTVLRMIQGIAVGGGWGGAVLLAMEWSPGHGQRGLAAAWPQFGVPCGLLLSNLAILAFSAWATGPDFLIWGWRIPFALSIILVSIGLWILLGIRETPVFQRLLESDKIEKAPIVEVIMKQPKEIILSALLRLSELSPFYIFTAFVFVYAVGSLKMDRNLILSAVMAATCVSLFTIPLAGHFSDVIGRKKMYLIGVAAMGIFGFVYFGMMDSHNPALVFTAIVLSLIPHDLQSGPQAALIAEAFTPRLRYSGASLGYQLASVIAGGPAPLIATWLFATYHSGYAISVYIAILAIVSFIAAAMMPDYTAKDISEEAYNIELTGSANSMSYSSRQSSSRNLAHVGAPREGILSLSLVTISLCGGVAVVVILLYLSPIFSTYAFLGTSIVLAGTSSVFVSPVRELVSSGVLTKLRSIGVLVLGACLGSAFSIYHVHEDEFIPLVSVGVAFCGISFLAYHAICASQLRSKIGLYIVAFILTYETWLLFRSVIGG